MKRFAFILICLGSVGVVGYALAAYLIATPGSTVHPAMKAVYAEHRMGIMAHVLASGVALLLGPAQFVGGLRARAPSVHRALGRLYLGVGVFVGGSAGLYMAFLAYGGLVAKAGFAVLSLCWLASGALAFAAVRGRRLDRHRDWMIRNFALTFAAVTLRVQLGLGSALGVPFDDLYPVLAWSSWIPNLLVAEVLVRVQRRRPVVHASAGMAA